MLAKVCKVLASDPANELFFRPEGIIQAVTFHVFDVGKELRTYCLLSSGSNRFLYLDAIQFNSLPGLQRLLPDGNFSNMQVKVLLGVPSDFVESVDTSTVENVFPYGKVSVDVVVGGLLCHSGIVIAEHKDGPEDDRAIVVVASVEVYC